MLGKSFQATSLSEKHPSSPSRRGALRDLFSGLNIGSANRTFSGISNRTDSKRRIPKPLPTVPEPVKEASKATVLPLYHEVKRICMPEPKRIPRLFGPDNLPIWTKQSTTDSSQKQEFNFYNQQTMQRVRCCESETRNLIE